jgi:serine/threonine protein kinase
VKRTLNLKPTQLVPINPAKTPGAEPIAGYRLITPLGHGGFGEVWKCQAPGQILKAIKFVQGPIHPLGIGDGRLQRELDALQRVKNIRHPFLLSLERVEVVEGELVVVMELADCSLRDLLTEHRQAGTAGIPRTALLKYLTEAAEVLDLMNVEHDLQHLDIKPHNLLLVSHHVKVADFGLVHDMGTSEETRSRGPVLGGISPCYAAPELFRDSLSPHSDQYSLAITYHELLTGTLPFRGKSLLEFAKKHTQEAPDLSSLPAGDRPAVARALAKDPRERFAACLDFVQALVEAKAPTPSEVRALERFDRESAPSLPSGTARSSRTGPQAASGSQARPYGEIDLSRLRHRSEAPRDPPSHESLQSSTNGTFSEAAARAGLPPGCRIQSCVSRGSCSEVWKVRDPLGQERVVRIYLGTSATEPRTEQRLLPELSGLRHPALPPVEVLRREPGRLVLLTEPTGKTLRDRFHECQSQKQLGIPCQELLDYLTQAAEALDQLFELYGVHHLWLHPHSLLLAEEQLRLADFGIAQLFMLEAGPPGTWLHPRYAPPELFEGAVGPTCDPYSLAAIYAEMLTGIHPFHGQSVRHPAAARRKGRINLDLVPAAERDILARALDPAPDRRFPTCMALLDALARASDNPGQRAEAPFSTRTTKVSPAFGHTPWAEWSTWQEEALGELIKSAAGCWQIQKSGPLHLRLRPGELLEHHCHTHGPIALTTYKLEGFCKQWQTRPVPGGDGQFTFRLAAPTGFWQRCLGRQPGLQVSVQLTPSANVAMLTDIRVQMAPTGCKREEGDQLLRNLGPVVLESLRSALLVGPERRAEERLPWHSPLQVAPVFPPGRVGEAIACQAKDISRNGIGLYLPHPLPTAQVMIQLPPLPHIPAFQVGGALVNQQKRPDGWIETGILLQKATKRSDSLRPRES